MEALDRFVGLRGCSKTGGGRDDRLVGGQQQWRCGQVPTRLCMGRMKKMRASVHKTEATSRRSGSTSRRSRGHINLTS